MRTTPPAPRSRRPRFAPTSLAALLAASLAACGGPGDGPRDVVLVEGGIQCTALRIEPMMPRVATEQAVALRAVGGSGLALFGAEGDALGSVVELGGGFQAGTRAGRVTVIARDSACALEARATVEVVGPFAVTPMLARTMRGGSVQFTPSGNVGDVRFAVLVRPPGAGTMGDVDATTGRFTAGMVDGTYDLVARDEGSGRSVRVRVEVGAGMPFAPRAAVLAVPRGERVELVWRGGSGAYTSMVSGAAGGRVVTEGERMFFDATDARAGAFADVAVTDTGTNARATVRVLVGEAVGPAPNPRGTQTGVGDMVAADFNADGRTDLIVGHAERSAIGRNSGGLLIYYGAMDGSFSAMPDAVLEGSQTEERMGSVLLARDVNMDGTTDLVVGVPDADLGELDRGEVLVYYGAREGLAATPDRVLSGEDINHRFGSGVALEDLTGDNAPDLVVGAPSAVAPTARTCQGGRVYVYRNRPGLRGSFETIPWQVLEVRAPLADTDNPPQCGTFGLGGGRALAVLDVDGDNFKDLAVGLPQESHGAGAGAGTQHGAVLVYRGRMGGQFEETPAWAIHLEAARRHNAAQFGLALDVVRNGAMGPGALVVRTPAFNAPVGAGGAAAASAGGLWVFPRESFPAPAPGAPGMTRPIKVLDTTAARAFAYGPGAGRGLGRSATVADMDGDGALDYVAGAAASGTAGSVMLFPLAQLFGSGRVMPAAEIAFMGNELQAYRVAALPGAMGTGAGLVSWAAWRNTRQGAFIGAVDYVGPGPGAIATRWAAMGARRAIELPAFGASDRAGANVALGPLTAAGMTDLLVGAPGANSPEYMMGGMTVPAGARLGTGAIEVWSPAATGTPPPPRAWLDRTGAAVGSLPFVVLNFDGGADFEVAIPDPGETSGTVPMGFATAGTCTAVNSTTMMPVAVGGRGVVRIFGLEGGRLVERFRAVPRAESRPNGMGWQLNRYGTALAAADVNGDGLDDLVVGRPGNLDGNGAEVVLGRARDAMGRTTLVCNTSEAYATPPATAADPNVYGLAVSNAGDIDDDGCDDIALATARNGAYTVNTAARAGVLLAFGYGPLCRNGHTTPLLVQLVPDERRLLDNAVGNAATRVDDTLDLAGIAGAMGRTLAQGSGDVTGDGVPDLVWRTAGLGFGTYLGPAVEVLSGAYLRRGACGGVGVRACTSTSGAAFVDGGYRVLGLRLVEAPNRLILPAPSTIAARFGTSLAVADITGDGVAELLVGSPDDSFAGSFAGAVLGWRGGAGFTQTALLGDPWLLAVGDVGERGEFGASVAAARTAGDGAWLAAGAPASTRNGTGGEVGAGFRWRVQVP